VTTSCIAHTGKTDLNHSMSAKDHETAQEARDHLLQHMRWISERFERMNEQLLTLSSTFIGFLAIELGLLAQIPAKTIREDNWSKGIGGVALLCLFVGIILFFITLLSKYFAIPKLEDFQDSSLLDVAEMRNEPYRMMISTQERDRNIQESLEEENNHLNRYYKPALIVSGVAQLVVVTFLIRLWTQN
jgi:hypothetical protein